MRLLTAILWALFSLQPEPAAWVAAALTGHPGDAPALMGIARRESRCMRIGVHAGDIDNDPSDGWGGQVYWGHLRKWCQPYRPDQWATRGAWGLSAASNWYYLPACYPPEVLDIPIVAAWVAAKKYRRECPQRRGWCRSKHRSC